MRVIFQAQYLTGDVSQMRQEDYDATFLVQAVKGATLNKNQFCWVKITGKNTKITEANKDRAVIWFAEWAAPQIDAFNQSPKVLIPIPGSDVTAKSSSDFKTAEIAKVISQHCKIKTTVAPVLRWKTTMTPSRKGGTRDKKELYSNLVVTDAIPPGLIVIIDDVYTTGGHLIACAWKIEDQKRPVPLAVCCGHTVHEQQNQPFKLEPENLDLAR